MSAFPASAVGLPVSMKYDLPPSLPDSARAYSVNVAPDGITSVSGGTFPTTTFTANVAGAFGAFTQQMVSFTLPSGMSDSVFLDPASTTLSFSLTYTIGNGSSATGASVNLIGSGASWFDQLVLYSNNVPIETINAYGQLQNFMLANTVNMAERWGGISVAMGADTNSATGIEIAHTTNGASYRYNFCIPLLSVIGANSDKFFPIGALNNIQLQMQTSALLPLVSYCTGVTTQPTLTGNFTLSEFTLNLKYIDVGDMAGALMKQTLQDGKWFIKSQTYTNSNVTMPSGSNGAQQLLLQIRNTSVKSLLHQFSTSSSATCPNGIYDAINPSLNSRQCQVGGNFYPNKPINDLQRPAEGYPYLIQSLAMGGGIAKSYGTIVSKDMYQACIPSVPAGSESYWVTPTSASIRTSATGADIITTNVTKYPNSFYCGYDLEKSSGILFQGVNTRASPPFLNLNLAQNTTSTVNIYAWGLSDVILEIDTISKQVKAYI